jgi:hypothetical protein
VLHIAALLFMLINLTVTPLVSEMHVDAGSSGVTSTNVTNTGDADERISVQPIDWTTRTDGAIALQRPGTQGSHSLTKYLEALSYRFILHPHETRRLQVALSMPSGAASAQSYWGGFIIKAEPLDGSLAIGPAATFFVYDDAGAPRRHVSITSAHVSQSTSSHAAYLTFHLKNDGDAYARTAGTLVVSKNGKTLREEHIPVGAILPGRDRVVRASVAGLASGTYDAEVTFDYGGDVIAGADMSVAVP